MRTILSALTLLVFTPSPIPAQSHDSCARASSAGFMEPGLPKLCR